MVTITIIIAVLVNASLISHCTSQFYNISDKLWNSEYASGKWRYIKTVAVERARNSVIAIYIDSYSSRNSSILDVGCGEGALYDHLPSERKKHYFGIDISQAAIDSAKLSSGSQNFTAISAEKFTTSSLYDVIIFNEMLYYTDHRAILNHYRSLLSPGGLVIVSVFFKTNVNVIMETIFKDVSRVFRWKVDDIVLHGSTQKNHKWKSVPVSFQIGVYRNR